MQKRIFHKSGQTRKLTVESVEGSGWEVRDEQNNFVRRRIRVRNWQRVERALLMFTWEVRAAGWTEA